ERSAIVEAGAVRRSVAQDEARDGIGGRGGKDGRQRGERNIFRRDGAAAAVENGGESEKGGELGGLEEIGIGIDNFIDHDSGAARQGDLAYGVQGHGSRSGSSGCERECTAGAVRVGS